MPDDYKQSQRIETLSGNATFNYYDTPPPKPSRPVPWGWVAGGVATLALAGGLVTTQLNARTVYYCASHNTVKYHTDATCNSLQQCGSKVRRMQLGIAKEKMDLCRACR